MNLYYADKDYLDTDGDPAHEHVAVYLAADVDARNAELQSALRDAIESVESWGAYASEYFQQKHDLAGELKRLRSFL